MDNEFDCALLEINENEPVFGSQLARYSRVTTGA